jgi:hypothetical protein
MANPERMVFPAQLEVQATPVVQAPSAHKESPALRATPAALGQSGPSGLLAILVKTVIQANQALLALLGQ